MRLAIVASEFNYDVTSVMVERATEHAAFMGAEVGPVVKVPGTYDIPLALKRVLGRDDVDAAVVLGAVIQGETDHDDVIMAQTARKVTDLSLEMGKPVGLGITGPGMSRAQAMKRVDQAKTAVEAALKLHRTLAELS
jgi:6,7-dimethyl-8-ribityllumazine synthase